MVRPYFQHKTFLHSVLRFNAAFSGLFGLLFLIFPGKFSAWTGIPSPAALTVTAVLLFIWEIFIFSLVKQEMINPLMIWVVIAGDLIWVLGSIALLMGDWLPLTTAGKWFIAVIADIVLAFAISQFIGIRRQQKPVHS